MANDTTPTGVPIIECAECGRRHPVTRSHCPVCGKASLFGLAAQFDRWLAAHDAEVRAPLEAEVERLRAKVGEQAEYLAYHLRDFRPRALEAHIPGPTRQDRA